MYFDERALALQLKGGIAFAIQGSGASAVG